MNVKINYITDGDIAGVLSVIGDNPKMTFIIVLEGQKVFSQLPHFLVTGVRYKEG